mmetsp:Transcript_10652/g.15593  ORF Transcript_10652/g.15593 Transcript_10652/m.15593 type:complete len:157 (+) Transcript_10652:38-508(+)
MVLRYYKANKQLVKDLISTLPWSAYPIRLPDVTYAPKLKGRQLKALELACEHHGLEYPYHRFSSQYKHHLRRPKKVYKKHGFVKNQKLRLKERNQAYHLAEICDALKTMPKEIEAVRKADRDRRQTDEWKFFKISKKQRRLDRIHLQNIKMRRMRK